MSSQRAYCSDLSRARGEPLLGTAAQVQAWLLLEYRPVWKPKAVVDNDLTASIRAWLNEATMALAVGGRKARVQFIRQPEEERGGVTLFVAADGALKRFRAGSYQDLLRLNLSAAAAEDVRDQQYFVCTNGQRDLCCARQGLPAYARLRELVGGRAWQTTHVGGHRFAPNVLTLPQGALYGRVGADAVVDFVATVEGGGLSLPHLRGRAAYPPLAQVAEAKVPGAGACLGVDGDAVTFATAAGARTVRVRRAAQPVAVIASCGGAAEREVYPFV